MALKLQGDTLAERIVSACKFRGWSKTEFFNSLHEQKRTINYPQVHDWMSGKSRPGGPNLDLIARVTGFQRDDFLVGLGDAHPDLADSGAAYERSRFEVRRFMQSGALAPFTDDEVRFLERCAADSLKDGKLSVALLGYRAAHAHDEESLDAWIAEIRKVFRTATRPVTTKPKPPSRRRKRQ